MRRSALSTCCALVLLASTAPVAGAASDSAAGLTFVYGRPLELTLAQLQRGEADDRLIVCNEGRSTAHNIKVRRSGFGFTFHAVPVSDGAVLGGPRLVTLGGARRRLRRLTRGHCARLVIVPKFGTQLDPTSFTGQLAVASTGAGVARRDLTLDGPADPKAPATSVAGTVNIKVVHKAGPFHFLASDHGKTVTIPLTSAPPGKRLDIPNTCSEGQAKPSDACPSIGAAALNAHTAQITLAGHVPDPVGAVVHLPVRVIGARRHGDYSGSIDPSGAGDQAHTIPVVVQVTDPWWWALIALLIGVGLAAWPLLWRGRWRVAAPLRERADGLQRGYSRAKLAFQGTGPTANFANIKPPESGDVDVYAADVKEAVRNLMHTMVFIDARRRAYQEIDKSLAMAESDIACWEDGTLLNALNEAKAALDDLQTWLCERHYARGWPQVAHVAAAVLAKRRLRIGEAAQVAADATATASLVSGWRVQAAAILRLQLWWHRIARAMLDAQLVEGEAFAGQQAIAYRLADLKRELAAVQDAGALERWTQDERRSELQAALWTLGAAYGVPEQPGEDDGGEPLSDEQWTALGIGEDAREQLELQEPVQFRRGRGRALVLGAQAAARTPANPVRLARNNRWIGDLVCVVLAVIVAVVAAMLTIVGDKNFGGLRDYLSVIVVGGAAQILIAAILPTINDVLGDRLGTIVQAPAAEAGA